MSAAGTMTVSVVFRGFALFLCIKRLLCLLITESTYKVETKTIAVDYSHDDIYPKIEKGLAGLEIGVLGKFLLRRYIL